MMIVSSGTDLKFHNSTSYDLIQVYRPADSSGQIRNVSWCKDGSWLIMVPNRGNAEIIRTKDDIRLLQTILGVTQPSAAVFQRTTKRNVAMSTNNGSVLIYDIKAKSIKKRFINTGSTVTLLDWNLKDTHLAIGCSDSQVTLYSNTTNQKSSVITIPGSKSVSALRFHTTLRSILSAASDEGVVAVWDTTSGREKMCIKAHNAPVTDLVFSSQNNKLLVSAGLDRTFQCYDIHNAVIALPVSTEHPLSAVDMAPDGFTVAAGSTRGMIYIYDLRKHNTPLKCIAAHSGEVRRVSYKPYAMESTDDSDLISEEKSVELEAKSSSISEDSFVNMLCYSTNQPEPTEQENTQSKIGSAAGDSFLNGFENFYLRTADNSVTEKPELSNLKIYDGVKNWLGSKENLNEPSPIIITDNISAGKISDLATKFVVFNSTPQRQAGNLLTVDTAADPNISKKVTISVDELQEIVKNVAKEVVNEQISDLSDTWRNSILDLLMVFSKQFVDLDTHMEQLFKQNSSPTNSHQSSQIQQLQQENDFLRNKINELLKKIASQRI